MEYISEAQFIKTMGKRLVYCTYMHKNQYCIVACNSLFYGSFVPITKYYNNITELFNTKPTEMPIVPNTVIDSCLY
jgi:hypothetical protein